MTELDSLLVLNAIPGLGNNRVSLLLERFGSAQKVLGCSTEELCAQNILPPDMIRRLKEFPTHEFLKKEYALMTQTDVCVVTLQDDDYPKLLKEIPDAPVLIYVKGTLSRDMNHAVAIVGSRWATVYGLSVAEKFAVELAERGITIVSGLARGIDTAAHRGALKAKGKTMAVLGGGLSQVYPPENQPLMEEICHAGAVISEFPMQSLPLAYHFPQRNRIISGLSLGVVVVEASQRSGALITSHFALEQGREVFAVPGRLDHPNSLGVHHLIKQGAKLVQHIDDVIEELKPQMADYRNKMDQNRMEEILVSAPSQRISAARLSEFEKKLLAAMTDHPIHIDELACQCQSTVPETTPALLNLELKHFIQQLPGKLFVRKF
jgi:DNA processing protein